MLVSIILPTWNRAHFIRDAINSVLAQSFTQWELIIVDDGSTDQTAAVAAEYDDVRIRYYKNNHSGYIGKVRNFGIQQAKGEMIAFLDSDDLWTSRKLEVQTNLLLRYPDAGFVISNGEEFGTGAIMTPEYTDLVVGDLFHPVLLDSQYCFYLPTFIFRRSLLPAVGMFDESVPSACDIHFFFRMSRTTTGIFTNDKLVRIRKHQANITKSNGTLAYENTLRMLRDFRNDGTINSRAYHRLAARTHYSIGLVLWRKKEFRNASRHFADSSLHDPLGFKAYLRTLGAFLRSLTLKT